MKDNAYIEYRRLQDIFRYPRNPKEHDLGVISRSLEHFGFINLIIINERTKQILAGHGRLAALKVMKRNNAPPPQNIKVGDSEDWFVPVLRGIYLDKAETKAFMVADNRLVEVGGWNDQQLSQILKTLLDKDLLDVTGFNTQDLDEMLQTFSPKEYMPIIADFDVTQEDIMLKDEELNALFTKRQQENIAKIRTAVCPQCQTQFSYTASKK